MSLLSSTEKQTQKKKAKGKTKKIACSKCGRVLNPKETLPNKTWNLISPMPDKEGRITLTIMGSFTCPNCGKSVRASLQKIKGDEIQGGAKPKREMLLERLQSAENKISLPDLANELGLELNSVMKATETLCKVRKVQGNVSGDYYYPE